ncbi:MAG: ketopantoate reductase family protein [Chloroflexi bacterium]|nr:ketopantoate reductase family protein [Chloroflexota bacterium]
MKIMVIGAGVLGSLYAARLQSSGNEVTLLARGERSRYLQENGVVLQEGESGPVTATPVRVVTEIDPQADYDLAVVLVRKNQLGPVCTMLSAAPRIQAVLFMFNNAAGPDEMIRAVGRQRVLLGFPGAGGRREGGVVHYILADSQPTTLGELDGTATPRLAAITEAFERAGFPVEQCAHMDAWLKTHVAVVSPIANALYLAGGDNYRLARTPDGMVLLVRAIQEGFQVLRALGIPVVPSKYRWMAYIPEPLLVAILRRGFDTQRSELLMARHARAARDEMRALADEFQQLARRSGLATPAIDELYRFTGEEVPPLPEGAGGIPMRWAGVVAGALAILAVCVGLGALGRRLRSLCGGEKSRPSCCASRTRRRENCRDRLGL